MRRSPEPCDPCSATTSPLVPAWKLAGTCRRYARVTPPNCIVWQFGSTTASLHAMATVLWLSVGAPPQESTSVAATARNNARSMRVFGSLRIRDVLTFTTLRSGRIVTGLAAAPDGDDLL